MIKRLFFILIFLVCLLRSNELFERFPKLKEKLAYVQLGDLPTPVIKLENMGKFLNHNQLYMKRDDLTGPMVDGARIFGGNKVRKLEYLLADALKCYARGVLTAGCAGSNHALATTIYARRLGLEPHIVLAPQINSAIVQRNLLLDTYYGADIMYATDLAQRRSVFEQFVREHADVYPIPVGGSVPLGCVGYVDAMFELKKQIDQKLVPEPDDIYIAVGSGGTTAGLILGCKAAGLKSKIHAVAVDDDPFAKIVGNLVRATNKLLHDLDETFPLFEWHEDDFVIETRFIGAGYGAMTPEAREAMAIAQKYEQITLEGTYSAKAFAAFVHDVAGGSLNNKTVFFWNTFSVGDFAELIKKVDCKKLSPTLSQYFQ